MLQNINDTTYYYGVFALVIERKLLADMREPSRVHKKQHCSLMKIKKPDPSTKQNLASEEGDESVFKYLLLLLRKGFHTPAYSFCSIEHLTLFL